MCRPPFCQYVFLILAVRSVSLPFPSNSEVAVGLSFFLSGDMCGGLRMRSPSSQCVFLIFAVLSVSLPFPGNSEVAVGT